MLAIKTGMPPEAAIAKSAFPNAIVLSGQMGLAQLIASLPSSVTHVASFGMCGGLRPGRPLVGDTVVAERLIDDTGEVYVTDVAWAQKLGHLAQASIVPYYSSGRYNESNTPGQRNAIFLKNGAWAVDDESLAVAQFAKSRGLPFAILRNVSDQWNDDVSITSKMLTSTGSVDPWEVFTAAVTSPVALMNIWRDYNTCKGALGAAAIAVGQTFGL